MRPFVGKARACASATLKEEKSRFSRDKLHFKQKCVHRTVAINRRRGPFPETYYLYSGPRPSGGSFPFLISYIASSSFIISPLGRREGISSLAISGCTFFPSGSSFWSYFGSLFNLRPVRGWSLVSG